MLHMKEGISVRLKQDHSGTKDGGSQSMEGLTEGVWVVGGDGTHWRSVGRSDGTDWNMWKNRLPGGESGRDTSESKETVEKMTALDQAREKRGVGRGGGSTGEGSLPVGGSFQDSQQDWLTDWR